jgi:glutamate dehydrogenase
MDDHPAALEALASEAADLVPQRRDAVAALARAALRRAGEYPPDAPARIASLFRLLDTRTSRPALRVTGTVLEIAVEDRPLLVSAVTDTLRVHGLRPRVLLTAAVGVERGADRRVTAVTAARHARERELLLHADLDAEPGPPVLADLRAALADALTATDDFDAMRREVEQVADSLEGEPAALLRWLLADNFVLLGTRWQGTGLGVLTGDDDPIVPPLPPDQPIRIARTERMARAPRRARMTAVSTRTADGGEHLLLGLFTQRAYAEPAGTVPVLRDLLAGILEAEDVADDSDDGRQLRTLFEALPKHELFAADPARLRATLADLLTVRRNRQVRVVALPDPAARAVSVLVALPRERFSVPVRHAVAELLTDRFSATGQDYRLSLDEQGQALLAFTLYLPRAALEVDTPRLERDIARLTRTFAEDLASQLGGQDAQQRAEAFVERLPAGYTETNDPATAAEDLLAVEALGDDEVRVAVRAVATDPPRLRRLRVHRSGSPIELSDFLPILENLGLTVTDQVQYRLAPDGDRQAVSLHDFTVRADRNLPASVELDVDADGPRVAEAVLAVLRERTESDSLDRLVLAAGLSWPDVEVLRAYRQYRRQVGTIFSPRFTDDALVANPAVATALVGLFAARFAPRPDSDEKAARHRLAEALEAVTQFEEDRILRGFAALVEATLRTNRWAATRRGCLSLKIDSTRVPEMPAPVPAVEVFVSARDVQGVHLRGGRVARGGLRWSDRREDLRTEVLGLLKAQMTKNALIVPTGAKGGFVLTRPPTDAAQLASAVRAAYTTFVRGLLDLTDTIVDGAVVTPEGVRRHDGDDPYLVVAADRGTATFSDLANRIAAEYGFWLGDAFASGGSAGYDHKAMGITARGAWVAVQRHFRSLDLDVQADPITVVGIGDMSGDVFGNAMLLSPELRLIGAFDHRHVFLDPDPDPVRSYAERARLAALPRSSWADYDPAALSPGGGVFSRRQKSVPLSPEVRAVLRVDTQQLSPPELIRALLRAPADLLFAGGIGTFVRAPGESDLDVGDRTNDSVRVTSAELGARVVGEGANLALTQRARVSYARRGGRCNTDFVDNAAGVDTSDREVNLKILLSGAIDAGELAPGDRDALLADLSNEVAAAVLHDVDRQIAALDWEDGASPALLDSYEALMVELVDAGRLRRDVELLPDTEEMDRRRDAGAGLTRPELAVLLCYAKVDHADRLLASRLPDARELGDTLARYFPPTVVERFGHLLAEHRLRRELVATVVANDLVNHMGVTYPSRTARELGTSHAEVAAGWWAACEVADAWSYWRTVEMLGERLTPALQVELAEEVDRLVDALARSYVRSGADGSLGDIVAQDRPAFVELAKSVEDAVPRTRRVDRARRVERWLDLGIPAEVAAPLGSLRELYVVPDVAAVAAQTDRGVRQVGEVFWRLSEALPFDDLSARLGTVTARGAWQYRQRRGLADDLRELRRTGATMVVLARPQDEPAEAVAAFLAQHPGADRRVGALLAALDRTGPDAGLDGVAVVVRALKDLLTSERRPLV